MTEKRFTPVDELTGLPLPILPTNELPNGVELPVYLNPHHHFHPKKAKLIRNPEEGGFLRNSRIQILPRWIHNQYHDIYRGPKIDKDEQKRLLLGIFAVVGYLPKYAIDAPESAKRDEDVIVEIEDDLYRQMIDKTLLKSEATKSKERRDRVCAYMMRVVLDQDVNIIDQLVIEQFLDTKNDNTRLEIGRLIINNLIEQSTEPIEPIYKQVYRKNMVRKRNIRQASGVIREVTCPQHQRYISDLETKVRQSVAA
ncbi:MAG: hypothetical protein WCP03_02485 [Candidatus Saccharibacteria bacterium]